MSKVKAGRKKANKFEIMVAKVAYILFMVSLIILKSVFNFLEMSESGDKPIF